MEHKYLVAIFITIGLVIVALISQPYLGDDNVIEENVENFLNKETGVDTDLSPKSPEKHDTDLDLIIKSERYCK